MFSRKKPKQQLHISIPEPCKENWDGMHVVDSVHRHCDSCAKNVVDFTKMSDDEVVLFFRNTKEHVCGRFRQEQLNRPYHPIPETTQPAKWWKAALLLPLTLFAKNSSAQQNDSVPLNDSLVVANDSLQSPVEVVPDSSLTANDTTTTEPDSLKTVVVDGDTEIVPTVEITELTYSGGAFATLGFCTSETYLMGAGIDVRTPTAIGMTQPCYFPGPPPPPVLDFVPLMSWNDPHPKEEGQFSETNKLHVAETDPNEPKPDPIPPTLPDRPWYEAILPEAIRPKRNA